MMGDKQLTVKKNKIKYNDETYERTPALMDLIFSIEPSKENIQNKKQMKIMQKF